MVEWVCSFIVGVVLVLALSFSIQHWNLRWGVEKRVTLGKLVGRLWADDCNPSGDATAPRQSQPLLRSGLLQTNLYISELCWCRRLDGSVDDGKPSFDFGKHIFWVIEDASDFGSVFSVGS